MKFLHFIRLGLPVLFLGCFATMHAQTDNKNYPFSWKETTDAWFKPKAFAYKCYATDLSSMAPKSVATAKAKSGHGPVASGDCKQATSPDACTLDLMNEKLKDVQLPNFSYPKGYSGVEYVTFDVLTTGKTTSYQVVKQPVACKPCIQKAVNLVASLGDWSPAIQDGSVVKSTVVVPVYFRL